MDPVKVHGILDWPTPKKVREVQSFLGFGNFYRRFIKDYSKIAKPLFELTKKDHEWDWTDQFQRAFDRLKEEFTTSPVLALPDQDKPFRIESDASDYAYGAVLSQPDDENRWHPVAYLSKSMTPAEQNYDIYDKELLGIIRALEHWRHYLEGAKHSVDIWTDHKDLEYFTKA